MCDTKAGELLFKLTIKSIKYIWLHISLNINELFKFNLKPLGTQILGFYMHNKKHLKISDNNLLSNVKYCHFKFLAVSESWVDLGVVIPIHIT